MPYTTVVAGTTITAAWSNTNNRNQVITPFASSSARDSAITSPIEGQYAHLTDTNVLTHYNGTVWVPTNNNLIAMQELTTDEGAPHSVDGNSDFVLNSIQVFATRNYRVTLKSQWAMTAAGTWIMNFSVDGVQTDRFGFTETGGAQNGTVSTSILWQPTSGTKTLRVALDEASGTSDFTFKADNTAGGIFKRQFLVEDIGPR
jgi:hypothetical protein